MSLTKEQGTKEASVQTDDLLGCLKDRISKVCDELFGSISMQPRPSPISPPPIKLKAIKQEESPSLTKSPPSKADCSGSLLVLAEVALKAEGNGNMRSLRTTEILPSDSDSGRSTGPGSCDGSPDTSIIQTPQHRPQNGLHLCSDSKFSKFSFGEPGSPQAIKQKMILPKAIQFGSPSSTCADLKARKRRKTKQPLNCSFCGKLFQNQSSLRQHESFHRPARPYQCEKCDKAYKTRSELNRHLVVHSGEKKHSCKLCGKKFLRKQYLKTHLLRHHETGITMVTPAATIGDPTMMIPGQTAVPVTVVQSAFVSKTEPLTWRCQLCLKIFVNNEDLMKHVRSYHDKRRSTVVKETEDSGLGDTEHKTLMSIKSEPCEG